MRLLLIPLTVALCAFFALEPSLVHAQGKSKKEIPPPEAITVSTKDGMIIHGTYFGSNLGKKAIPVIMLPGWERSQKDLTGLALAMQKEGLAVLTVDLRGHGNSKSIQGPGGQIVEIDLDRIRASDFEAFVAQDLEAVKGFLMQENNKGNLNIEMLTIVGCDFSATAALNFAAQDWSWPILPAMKQGQDVKGLILVSPPKTFKGFNANRALQVPAVKNELSIMIIAGQQDRTSFSDAKRVFSSIDKIRQKTVTDSKDRTVFFAAKPTGLEGTDLLVDPRSNCLKDILFFTKVHLAELQSSDPWTDRTTPLN
ncbi:alpha/beta hydrolase [Bremerella sp. T1]|uniref:alpha/beta hydrolase n=1 Tax=Bremerella sp. TYQ1 TaxID=3119568 RepID=UPI001CCF64B5|nr:alpha/beta hydrolase [Bremerella volcania]UBM37851.1 alpha/beta hydrolase [Bremerella volcania]